MFAFIFSFSFVDPASRLIRGVVYEKEAKIREGMRTMGLGHVSLLTSWYVTYALMVALQAGLITAVTANNIFSHSDKVVVFFTFLLFGLSTMAFCLLVRSACVRGVC